MNNHFKIWKRK